MISPVGPRMQETFTDSHTVPPSCRRVASSPFHSSPLRTVCQNFWYEASSGCPSRSTSICWSSRSSSERPLTAVNFGFTYWAQPSRSVITMATGDCSTARDRR